MTEDVSLCFHAIENLPGPYIKTCLSKLGRERLYKMLDGFEDKGATAQCIFAYCAEEGEEPIVFVGQATGKMVPPRGENLFGWDPIF